MFRRKKDRIDELEKQVRTLERQVKQLLCESGKHVWKITNDHYGQPKIKCKTCYKEYEDAKIT